MDGRIPKYISIELMTAIPKPRRHVKPEMTLWSKTGCNPTEADAVIDDRIIIGILKYLPNDLK
jgi:hypothetical protein